MESDANERMTRSCVPYERPIIEELGTVRELAFGGTPSVTSDSGSNQMRLP
jgi:hypothetical protein